METTWYSTGYESLADPVGRQTYINVYEEINIDHEFENSRFNVSFNFRVNLREFALLGWPLNKAQSFLKCFGEYGCERRDVFIDYR